MKRHVDAERDRAQRALERAAREHFASAERERELRLRGLGVAVVKLRSPEEARA